MKHFTSFLKARVQTVRGSKFYILVFFSNFSQKYEQYFPYD